MKNHKRSALARGELCAIALCVSLFVSGVAELYALPRENQPPFSPESVGAIAGEASNAAAAMLEKTGGSALSAALADSNGIVWQGQFGLADKAAGQAPDPDTMFGIGSTSKMFATTAAMILADRGLLDLEAPVLAYLPEFRMATPGYERITVRMLLNHSAGFPGTDYRGGDKRGPAPGYYQSVLKTLAMSRLKHEPGYMAVYSNDGFTLVEALVKAVTGLDYVDFVRAEILEPLGMSHSAYPVDPFAEGSFAKPYQGDRPLKQEILGALASGGLYSTPADLVRFGAMFMNKGAYGATRILSPGAVAAMAEDQTIGTFNPVPSDSWRFGLGWDSVSEEGLKAVGVRAWLKGGDVSSYGSVLIVAPDEGLAVAVTGASGIGSGQSTYIAERLLLRALVERGRIAAMPGPAVASQSSRTALFEAARRAIEGIYINYSMVLQAGFSEDETLYLRNLTPGGWVDMIGGFEAREDGWFASDSLPGIEILHSEADGRAYLTFGMISGAGHYRSPMMFAQRVVPEEAVSEAWQKRVGTTWLPINFDADDEYLAATKDPRALVLAIEGLPGYIAVQGPDGIMVGKPAAAASGSGTSDFEAHSFILIPQVMGRDLFDIVVLPKNGKEFLRLGSSLYRPLDGLSSLSFGVSCIEIGPEGLAEWRKVPAGALIETLGATEWLLYDASFSQVCAGRGDMKSVSTPEGGEGYILVWGAAGSKVELSLP